MAKIDDLAELLVEELSDFKTHIHKMEQLSKELRTISLTPDMKEMRTVLNSNLKQREELSKVQNKRLYDLTRELSKSNHYPNWLTALLGTSLLIFLLLTSYYIYELKASSEINKEYYTRGQKEVIAHFNEFLKNDKEANEAYQKWRNIKTK